MKNPRRTRNAGGQEVAPATVGSKRADGIRVAEIWCGECQHHAEISTDDMPADLAFPDIYLCYRCSACSSRNLTSRPSVMAH